MLLSDWRAVAAACFCQQLGTPPWPQGGPRTSCMLAGRLQTLTQPLIAGTLPRPQTAASKLHSLRLTNTPPS